MNEKELFERLIQRDDSAFRILVEGWKDRIYNTALGLVQDEEDAADIAQEVFVSAWLGLNSYRGDAGITTWLYRITVNKCMDLLRKRKRKLLWSKLFHSGREEDPEENNALEFHHPGVLLEKKQEAAILLTAIRQLPGNQRIAFSLQKIEGLSQQEISAIMEISEGAVESLLQRAKTNLKKYLNSYLKQNNQL
ncbi:RNA polymerase sigma factor [Flavihumibacter rivuli]|uniref:RNA polymerase sigma factor n=1 Tax=Flavihumibacter rivuli TaxID=2838156 RepID=UPI001BDF3C15|nr:RNA polymerase sigma factor [Flavihumibacter rivuli]ULQ56556.1 RNA polymerase sigma factor [Flavihumibacter rivuli]